MFILTAVVHKFAPIWFQRRGSADINGGTSVLSGFLTAAAISILGFVLTNRYYPDWVWGKIGGLILIQPTRLPLYLALFALGIHANTRGWFTVHAFPGKAKVWLAACVIFSIALIAYIGSMDMATVPTPWHQAIAHAVLRSLSVLCFLGFFITATQQRGNRPSLVWQNLHQVSYDIYILHLPLVVICQLVLLPLPMSALAKFALAGLGPLVVSWALGRYLIEPYPVPAGGLLLTGFALSAFYWAG
jgi:glucans biosynthesis protein C